MDAEQRAREIMRDLRMHPGTLPAEERTEQAIAAALEAAERERDELLGRGYPPPFNAEAKAREILSTNDLESEDPPRSGCQVMDVWELQRAITSALQDTWDQAESVRSDALRRWLNNTTEKLVAAQAENEQLREAAEPILRVADTAFLPGPVHLSIAEVNALRAALAPRDAAGG